MLRERMSKDSALPLPLPLRVSVSVSALFFVRLLLFFFLKQQGCFRLSGAPRKAPTPPARLTGMTIPHYLLACRCRFLTAAYLYLTTSACEARLDVCVVCVCVSNKTATHFMQQKCAFVLVYVYV
jgi:hypothetical protein